MNIKTTSMCIAIAAITALPASAEDMSADIARARSAAPASVSADATIVVNGEVVVEGSNGWTCMPEALPGTGAMCNDAVWMKLMQAIGDKADFTPGSVGISYMLQGDPPGGGVSNADPFHADPQSAPDYVEEGPHLMIAVPREMLKGITDDPGQGGPYVMWGNTPYAHIMVPISD